MISPGATHRSRLEHHGKESVVREAIMPMLDMTNARHWNVRDKSIEIMLRLGLGVVCLGAFWAAQAESIPTDSPRWQLEGKAKATEYLGRFSLARSTYGACRLAGSFRNRFLAGIHPHPFGRGNVDSLLRTAIPAEPPSPPHT